jgi:hypothetical protein
MVLEDKWIGLSLAVTSTLAIGMRHTALKIVVAQLR